MTFIDTRVRDLLNALSSSDPTPGGGSAAALASAVGASLLMMVARLPKTRSNAPDDRAALDGAAKALGPIRDELSLAVDADAAAYDQVVAAYRLPKGSPDEQEARKTAIQRALRAAIDVPLGVIGLSSRAMQQAVIVAAHGHRAAASDVGVAAALLQAGAAGARLNVETNVQSISDATYSKEVRDRVQALASEVSTSAQALAADLNS